ncbi:MAG: sigma 54-interacting transcriptional regulator [Desulfobacterales bacterium]|nr:sigma 54-interacting transcriptional regulator [Desulfobacterales bacterium]
MHPTEETLKLELNFTDRIGIVADLTRVITSQGFNITAMEVLEKENVATVYLEIATPRPVPEQPHPVENAFSQLEGFLTLNRVRTLPRERREKHYQAIFDGVSEGIIATDETGCVTTVNPVACQILGYQANQIIGQNVQTITPSSNILLECLGQRRSINRQETLLTPRGRVAFYASAQPITDSSHRFMGAVVLMKDLQKVQRMAREVTASPCPTFGSFVGKSPIMHQAIELARRIAPTDATVSIRGESGTGKELFAGAIHFESGREGPFIPVNCAAMPETLLESELFGYADGAFTGARKSGKPGLFEVASGGTLFLDEIGEMPPGPQAKILRVLQDGLIRRIGGSREIPVKTRIITATHKNLEEMVREGTFREDLYYRINVVPIHIAPLRERGEDILDLAQHFLNLLAENLEKKRQKISSAAVEKLLSHHWPGNVRELKNVMERGAILSDGDVVDPSAILFSHEANQGHLVKSVQPELKPLKHLTAQFETGVIQQALTEMGSIRKAAAKLGVSHTALIQKMKKYGVKVVTKQTIGLKKHQQNNPLL